MKSELLTNYRALLTKVDELCATIATAQQAHIVCRPGCDACCRHLTLFAVEAAHLGAALRTLPPPQQEAVRRQAEAATPDGPCPLLVDNRCALYAARPIICRTHGLPLLLGSGAERRVDFCPENFQGVASLPAAALIDLEKLNQLLSAVNAVFVRDSGTADRRATIAAALLQG